MGEGAGGEGSREINFRDQILFKKYAQVINKREWVLNRPTRHRAGAFWPKGGFLLQR